MKLLNTVFIFFLITKVLSAEIIKDQIAPDFTLLNQDGNRFELSSRKGKGWTVLYFYPKAETPGCTKQACAFRDSIKVIKDLGAEVYGISGDNVSDQKKFHSNHQLPFDLLADPEAKIIDLYGAKVPMFKISKRWTFILDPDLIIRYINRDVDPMLDAKNVSEEIKKLKK